MEFCLQIEYHLYAKHLVKNKLTAMSKGKYRAAYRTKAAQR